MKALWVWKQVTCRRFVLIIGFCLLLSTTSLLWVQPASAADPAYIRVMHASPDIGIVDVFVDGQKILSNFQFATITDYRPLAPGSHSVQLALIGKGVDAAIVTQTMTVHDDTAYTIAALGTNQSGFSFTVFTDNNRISGQGARIRFYHLSPGTGSAQVSTSTPSLVNNLSYPHASDYISLADGMYTISLTSANPSATLSQQVTLAPWTIVSVFAVGLPQGSPPWRLIVAQQQGIPAMPQTGSDPNAAPTGHELPWPSVLRMTLVLAFLSGCIYLCVVARTRRANLRSGRCIIEQRGREGISIHAGATSEE